LPLTAGAAGAAGATSLAGGGCGAWGVAARAPA
jgi:hypothetical protein